MKNLKLKKWANTMASFVMKNSGKIGQQCQLRT
jgi:hypothetical protein